MASLPYPLNRLYTHIVSVIATTQSACILMSVWVWQGCHTLLQIPILLFLKNLFFCSSVFSKTTCSHVLMSSKQKHVFMFFCLFKNNLFSCSSVFSTTTCSHVLLSFQKQHVLMFSCLSKTTCSSVFPPKEPYPPSNPVFMSPKKTAESNAPSR